MELYQIDHFIAVSRHKHFTKAALEQRISQPALSRSIKKLEEELGVPLFIRKTKSIRLTKYGEQFLIKAKQARLALDEGVQQIRESVNPNAGEISVSFLHTLGSRLMPQLIAGFKKKYPNVAFRLYQAANEHLQHMVETGEADICLSSPPLPNELLEWTVLDTEPLYLVLPADHPLADRKEVAIRSFAHETLSVLSRVMVFDMCLIKCAGNCPSARSLRLKGKKCRRFWALYQQGSVRRSCRKRRNTSILRWHFAECQTTVLRGRSVSPF